MSNRTDGNSAEQAGGIEPEQSPLLWEIDGNRLRCILNRPSALNALTPQLLFDLASIVGGIGRDPGVSIVTIEGSGGKAFSAGFDLKVLASLGRQAHEGDPLAVANEAILNCSKPTVAIIDGFCLGAGLDTAMSCDFRIATTNSKFSIPALKIGTVYRPQSIEKIWRRLGSTVTKELFVLGREFSATEAYNAGIVQAVVEPEELDATVANWVKIPDPGISASQAHKTIIDAFEKTMDRSEEFWSPLDALRERSVDSKERQSAVKAFADPLRKGGS